VGPLSGDADALRALAPGPRACAAADDASGGPALLALVTEQGSVRPVDGTPPEVAAAASAQGCTSLVWTGTAGGAATVARGLPASLPLLLGPGARTGAFLDAVGPVDGIVGVCGCADLTTTHAPADQSFVHGYQSATGLEPGPYAVEGRDAATFLLGPPGSPLTRAAIRERLRDTTTFAGLGGPYRWTAAGQLVAPAVRTYGTTGIRWREAVPTP
jgi:ABC-type branched-subunit amino acid transport system substrate-binding protein